MGTYDKPQHPISIADRARNLADYILSGYYPRSGGHATYAYEDICAEFERASELYEGELMDSIQQLLDLTLEIMTCPEAKYDVKYVDFRNKTDQLDREIVKNYSSVRTRRNVS